ncbi:MFS transporter [Chitinophaga sp.]|uniref:MDR family MFS transporter n=1 Tax=Chitinophaga sp. TaxID=1869181 RepID=UPI0031DE1739
MQTHMYNKTISLYRNAYSGISPRVWWLAVVLLINRSGNMVIPFLTIYLTFELHLPLEQAGIIMTLFGAGAICGSLLGGKLADTIGFYPVQFWSLVLNGTMFILLGQMHTFPSLAAAIFFQGLIGESFRPANAAAVAHYSDAAGRLRAYSLIRLATNLGWAVGPALGGMLAAIGYKWLFWTDGLVCITAGLLMRMVLPPVKVLREKKEEKETQVKRLDSAYKDWVYLFFILLVTLFAVCLFQMFTIVGVFFKDKLQLTEGLIGIALSVNGLLIALVEMVLVYKLENKRPDVYYISIGALLMGLAYLVFNIFPAVTALAFIYIITFTFAEMMTLPFMNNFWIHRSKDHNRGQYAGLYMACYSAAHLIAPTLGAFVVKNLGYSAWWYMVAGICVLTFIGFRWLFRRVQNPLHSSPASVPSVG